MTHSYLNSFTNFESRLHDLKPQSFRLERVHGLLRALGDSQKKLRFVHVAGTKGKGSTCAFIAHILRAAGYRVGLYTSPHFYHINERIRILSPSDKNIQNDFHGLITDRELSALVSKYKSPIDRAHNDKEWGSLTYFEVLTGLALCYFARKKTDIVIWETGLGGRLDATNAVAALVDVITPISFDHTQLLGKTLEKIAAEKAAIIKDAKSKVVVGLQPVQAMKVIKERCRKFGIRPLVIRKSSKYKNIKMGLIGEHQIQNAATAVAVVESLAEFGFKVSVKDIVRGFGETRWPGRFEIIHKSPTVIVDCAHNPASAKVLVKTVRQSFGDKKVILILGLSLDKDIEGICAELKKIARLVILTQSKHPRAFHFDERRAKKIFRNKPVLIGSSVRAALTSALHHAGAQDIILAAGSVFIAAEVRALLKKVK